MSRRIMTFGLIITVLSVILLAQCHSTSAPSTVEEDIVKDDLEKIGADISAHENQNVNFKEESSGWSVWSTWSECSRSCNGGVTYQLRKCENSIGCKGKSSKYRICNMQACPDSQDFRASQCAAYNPVPYRGRLYEWLPYQDPEEPCSLTCHARSYSFVAKLAPSVRDGTRCREGSLDMCVDGKCLAVGCDLQLGSERKVDECGVCGGDGSTCKRPIYVWNKTPFSPCSASCGGGYQMSRPTCLNKATEKEVDERLCDVTSRPRPEIKECNPEKCPPVWVTDSWSPCSASCGGGRQSRQVHCAQTVLNGARSPVPAERCLRQKPVTERPCNLLPCPQWDEGPWSGCSVTCGQGQKSRSVACKDAKGLHSEDCDVEVMPSTKMDCDSGLICTASEDPGAYLFSDIFKGSQEDAPPRPPYYSLPWMQSMPDVSTEPSFVAGEWGPCSVTCGQGVRKRTVDCKIFLEFSRTVAKLPDKECPGSRPPDTESCHPHPCSLDHSKPEEKKKPKTYVGIEVTYSWRTSGFTPCSASCLGGTRESVIQCVRDHDQAVVKPTQCDITKKPDAITQTCNDHPCPPKWNVSEYSPCSKPCGGGYQTRRVHCLHEVLRGASNTIIVENSNCPQPAPRDRQLCNVFECPTRWKMEAWTKCSRSCGGGEKTRKIRCTRVQAFGQLVELAPSLCPKRRPKTMQPCNMKPCPSPEDFEPTSHQSFVQKSPQRRVFLKVGGRALVFAETNVKIRCPSRNGNKTGIVWYKDDVKIKSSKRMKISMKGALRIRRIAYKDSGKYTCASGSSKSDIHITVKPVPPSHSGIDEGRTVERPDNAEGNRGKHRTSEEKFSHERNRQTSLETGDDRVQVIQPSKTDLDNSVEDTYEKNYKQFHYKTNQDNQNSHQNFNKAKTENSDVNLSDLDRVPLYIQVKHNKSQSNSTTANPMEGFSPTPDSEELVPHREHPNRAKPKTKPYDSEERSSPNHIYPPRYGDTWDQKYDGSLRAKNKVKSNDVWDKNHGGALFSDQESGELNIGTPHGGKGFPGLEPAHSGASSIHGGSHIQKMLFNLQLGGRTFNAHEVEDREDALATSNEDESDPLFPDPTMMMANSFVLGKGKAENLQFDWVITEWSTCSQTCGGTGYQVRASQCLVRLNNVSRTVDSTLCEDAGLPTPTTVQSCGYDDCPHWETAPWSPCLESQCFTWHTAYQKRVIYCRTSNGTDMELSHCDEKTRPRRKRECYSDRCRSTWRVGEWSECTASCSKHGFQSRILQCVWFGSTRPAGNACRDQQRPVVMRPCRGPPCQSNDICTDRSSYCSLAKTLHMCHLSRFHLQCCESCRAGKG